MERRALRCADMYTLFITIPIVTLAWILYSSRNALLVVGRWALRRRYSVALTGTESIDRKRVHLIIPNHPAIVDPLVLVTELHNMRIDVRPLVDESFFSNRMTRHVLALFDAVRVPDFRHSNFRPLLKIRPSWHNAARRARSLGYTVLATLSNERDVLLYPSGHITADGRESIGSRQLAYNVISQIPHDVQIIGVRIRGLYGSMWSRAGGRPAPPYVRTFVKSIFMWPLSGFRRKRKVELHFEDLSDKCRLWAPAGRLPFNCNLEKWYDADLASLGKDSEGAT